MSHEFWAILQTLHIHVAATIIASSLTNDNLVIVDITAAPARYIVGQ